MGRQFLGNRKLIPAVVIKPFSPGVVDVGNARVEGSLYRAPTSYFVNAEPASAREAGPSAT